MKDDCEAVKSRIKEYIRRNNNIDISSYNIYDSKSPKPVKLVKACKPTKKARNSEPFTLAKKFIHLHLLGGGNLTIARQDFLCACDRTEGFTNVFVKDQDEPFVVRESEEEVYDSYFKTRRYQSA